MEQALERIKDIRPARTTAQVLALRLWVVFIVTILLFALGLEIMIPDIVV